MIRPYLRPAVGLFRSALGTNGMAARLTAMEAKLDNLNATSAEPPQPPRPVIDINLMLHQARSAMLREMPPGAGRLVSAGCAGAWYFDWIAQCYGPVAEHVGIEFYMPRPDGLPTNATWIANTASNMEALGDASCDLMFSGQNIEHLWADEVAGFMLEAARVVRPGGMLVLDSPNRDMTAPLNWSHPEHTVELTPGEIRHIMELAGFEVTKEAGMWLCRDPRTGRRLPYDPNEADADWSFPERLVVARHHPEHSFLWWIEGRRNGPAADRAAIEAYLAGIYSHAWPERTRRMRVPAGQPTEMRGMEEWVLADPGLSACVLYGPYMPLRSGRYTAAFRMETHPGWQGGAGRCEVVAGNKVLSRQDILPGVAATTLSFELPALQFGLEFRCVTTGGIAAVRRHVVLTEV